MTSLRQLVRAPNESDLQRQIVDGLRALNYVVLEIGRYVRQVQCPHCRGWHTPHSGTGSTPGAPDLLVARSLSLPPLRNVGKERGPQWYGIELKTPAVHTVIGSAPAGRLRPEQRALADAGLITVAHTIEECLEALEAR